MNKLHDLMRKLQSIEENAKTSDIPAAQRKAKNPQDWKVSMKDLEAEEKEGKISHKDNLAKNSGRADEAMAEPVSDAAPENSEIPQGSEEEAIAECGDEPMHGGDGKVSMSMQDLLALMTQLQKGHVGGDEPLMGGEEEEYAAEEYGNSLEGDAGENTMPVAAVTATGNDMFSKGKEAPKVNGGGNPMEEALAALYADVKTRQLDELSKGTLASYAKKASAGASNSAFNAGMTRDDKQFSKHNAKASKREAGLDKAIDKLSLKEANQMARRLRK
jgi:hypothetical protein